MVITLMLLLLALDYTQSNVECPAFLSTMLSLPKNIEATAAWATATQTCYVPQVAALLTALKSMKIIKSPQAQIPAGSWAILSTLGMFQSCHLFGLASIAKTCSFTMACSTLPYVANKGFRGITMHSRQKHVVIDTTHQHHNDSDLLRIHNKSPTSLH